MQTLTQASDELFRRTRDEQFPSLQALWQHCHEQKEQSTDRWHPPGEVEAVPDGGRLMLSLGGDDPLSLNDWSFGQLCKLANVSKDTVNRLTATTASQVFEETLSSGSQAGKPLQVFTSDRPEQPSVVRSIHGASYTRLHNVDLLTMLREFATDFEPPQEGIEGATGVYCGEQDMFVFLIDPTGWAEIDGQAFAPGLFLWNSEVGKRSVGVQTFWFQAVCQNHIVWDAVEVVDFSRKHTANVHDAVRQIRDIIAQLIEKRDERRDGFVEVIQKAMLQKFGDDPDDVLKILTRQGITKAMAKEALEIAQERGAFTVFCIVDALTRLAGRMQHAGDRAEVDQKASKLLSLVA